MSGSCSGHSSESPVRRQADLECNSYIACHLLTEGAFEILRIRNPVNSRFSFLKLL